MASGRKKLSPQRELRELRAMVRDLEESKTRVDLLSQEVASSTANNRVLREDLAAIQGELVRLTVENSQLRRTSDRADCLEMDLKRAQEEADATRASLREVSKYSRKVIRDLVGTIREGE